MSDKSKLLSSVIKEDREFNQRLARKLHQTWLAKGYDITFYVQYNEQFQIHEIRSEGLVGGRPIGKHNGKN